MSIISTKKVNIFAYSISESCLFKIKKKIYFYYILVESSSMIAAFLGETA